MSRAIYSPFKFTRELEIISIAVIASFVTMKLLNGLYEHVYEPVITRCIMKNDTKKYYLIINDTYFKLGNIVEEISKWVIIILLLMIVYNIYKNYQSKI